MVLIIKLQCSLWSYWNIIHTMVNEVNLLKKASIWGHICVIQDDYYQKKSRITQ